MGSNQLKKVACIRNDKGHSAPAMCAWQKGSGNYLALRFEGVHVVYIYDRQGKLYKKIPIPINCIALDWDADGDILCIMIETAGMVVLWEAHSGRLIELDSGLRETSTVLAWSGQGKILAVATSKGNFVLYDHRTMRKIPVIGNHTKKITCARWSRDDVLALGTMEDQISLNKRTGDLIRYLQLRGRPTDLQFGCIKEDQSTSGSSSLNNTISCIVGEKTLFLVKYDDPTSSPLELGFQARYGSLLSHFWHGDGYIAVVFVGGFLVLLSTYHKEIGTELVLCDLKEDLVKNAAINLDKGWISICCGGSTLRIHEASEPKTTLSVTDITDDDGRTRQIVRSQWTDDGQLLSVNSSMGDVLLYLTSVPMMGGANYNQLAAMSSLTECVLYSIASGSPSMEYTFIFQGQPSLVVLGPIFLAAIIHSSAYLYNTRKEIGPFDNAPIHKKEFNYNITEFVMNHSYCAALCGSTAHLHKIEGEGTERKDLKSFPESSGNAKGHKITAIAISKEIFLYGGANGQVRLFHLEQFTEIMVIELPNQSGIKRIHPDFSGGQGVLIDRHGAGFFFDVLRPSESSSSLLCQAIDNFPPKSDGILFDMEFNSRHIFLVYSSSSSQLHLYSAWKDAAGKGLVEFVGYCNQKYSDYKPICFKKGILYSITGAGKIDRSSSVYHQQMLDDSRGPSASAEKTNIIKSLVNLKLFHEAYDLCCVNAERSDSSASWEYLAELALESGQLEIASKAHAKLGNVGMVLTVKRMMEEAEDLNALQGEVAMIQGDFDLAEVKFLEAGLKDKALELRRDLQEWDKAMEMADKFNSPLISEIAREYAAVFEYNQDYSSALLHYQKAKNRFAGGRILSMKHAMNQIIADSIAATPSSTAATATSGSGDAPEQYSLTKNTLSSRDATILLEIDKGIARNMLRTGLESDAVEMISSIASRDPTFVKECAAILESEKKYERAAKLYLECSEEPRAAACYIKLKKFSEAQEILGKKSVPEIWRQFAKAKEAEGNLIEAAKAYADAFDFENGIRLYLTLGIPEEAATLSRMSDDPQDAVKVALFYLEKGELDEALNYLVRSECYNDALANAFKFGKTEYYADFVFHHFKGDYPEGFAAGLAQVAADFEGKKDNYRAGKCYQYLRQYGKSFHHLLKAAYNRVQANEEEVMVTLIHTVVYSEEEDMARSLVEFLLGETDGTPKDPFYLHYYYVMAEKYVEASKTAVIVSKSYQDQGSFLEARNSVFDSMCWLKNTGARFNKDTVDQFNLTQSYMILRTLLSQKDKNVPARIIVRIFDNISRFAKACPGLLLAGVNTCQQVGLKHSARQMAFTLIRDYKTQLDEKFRPAIEQLVRKTGKVDCVDEPDTASPCPYCNELVGDFSLDCRFCRSLIPMCIVSGQHILKSDLGACSSCNFPFRFGEMKRFQSLMKECPVCMVNWEGNSMKKLNDVRPYLYDNISVEP